MGISVANMVLLSVIYVATLVTLTASYDFSDPVFNEYLQTELKELGDLVAEDKIGTIRVQRNADHSQNQDVADDYFKCKHRNLKSCCGKLNIMKNYGEKGKPYGKECYEKVMNDFKSIQNSSAPSDDDDGMMDMFSCEKIKLVKMKHICVHECIGKKTKIINEDGSLSPDGIRQYAKENMFTEDWSKELGGKAVEKCLSQNYNHMVKMEDMEGKCNPTSVQFQYCLWREIETNCPESKMDTKPKCIRLRERLRKLNSSGM
ncbi:uncharacterized protein LOC142318774 [Lycorma delicatula]|uniref:uncharacterized protein LOC142318774 n=1 Tax=Lycorma delicatula TaxID=130591 RepID=UPI003F5162F2